MANTNRKDLRDDLKTLFTDELVGENLPVKTVEDSKVTSLEGETPLLSILSAGSTRGRMTPEGFRAGFRFTLQVWVIQSMSGWSYADAEDALDDIEADIADIISDNAVTSDWDHLELDGESEVNEAVVSGVPYYMESIPIAVYLGGE